MSHDRMTRRGVLGRLTALVLSLPILRSDLIGQERRPDLAAAQMDKIKTSEVERMHFAWAGSLEPGKPHYYRIHSPKLLVEYDNTQNNANHIHTVYRDLANDFGEDMLRRHYEQSGHHD